MEFGSVIPPPQEARRGRWLLAIGVSVAVVVLVIVGLSASDDTSHQEPESRDPKVVVIPNSAIDSVPTGNDEELIVLPTAPRIDRGDFLTTKPGPNARRGFLLKALSVNEVDGKAVVETEPASLFEAVPAGSLVANPADFRPTHRLRQIEQAERLAWPEWEQQLEREEQQEQEERLGLEEKLERERQLAPAVFRREVSLLNHFWPSFDCDQTFDPDNEQSRFVRLHPIFKPKFKPVFDMRWNDKKWWKKRVETAEAGLRGELRIGVIGSLGGSLKCSLEPELKVPVFVAAVPVGPVPVPLKAVVTVQPTVKAKIDTRIRGKVEFRVNGFAGLEYDGEKLHPKGTMAPKWKTKLPTLDQRWSAGVGVMPGVAVQAGWTGPLGKLAASAHLLFPTEVEVKFVPVPDTNASPEACVPLKLHGRIRFHLPHKKNPYSVPTPQLTLFEECQDLGGKDVGEDGEPTPPEAK